ncbi:hypothetical protein MRY87_03915 [bacterium]|nr:hypothetical protein [bacterium]
MKKVSDTVRGIVEESTFLRFGFQYHLLNLTQLAKFIQPLVEARVKKEVSSSAIVMSLSRLGKEFSSKELGAVRFFHIHNIIIHTQLHVVTLLKNPENHREVHLLYQKVQKKGGLISVTEGLTEITLTFEAKYEKLAKEVLSAKPKRWEEEVGSLTVKFDDRYGEEPGFLYAVLRQIALQSINIVEVSSTATEFILYLQERDIQLAFDTLYRTFSAREHHGLLPV